VDKKTERPPLFPRDPGQNVSTGRGSYDLGGVPAVIATTGNRDWRSPTCTAL